MKPAESTASPFGNPVTETVRRCLPSALIWVTQPRSPPSTAGKVPSGRATGPSGKNNPVAKTLFIVNLSGLQSNSFYLQPIDQVFQSTAVKERSKQAAAQQQRAAEVQKAQKTTACTQQLLKADLDGGRSDPNGFQEAYLACVRVQ
jgi:hypothetical protein